MNGMVFLPPLLIFLGITLVGFVLRAILYSFFSRLATQSSSRSGDLILDATRLASLFWVPVAALLVMLQIPEALPERLLRFSDKLLVALLILSFTLVAARVVSDLIHYYATRHQGEVLPVTGLTKTAARWIVGILGILILCNSIGINITPVLTALGIGGLAVALALQDTLSNLFAGFYVTLAREIRPGQRLHLDSGQEGYLIDIGWRTTTLRAPSNYLIIIPNSKLAQSIITNYNFPDEPVNIVLNIGVSYDSDPAHVEKVLMEVSRTAMEELPGFVKSFEPIVRFQDFGDSSLNFLLILQVESYDSQFAVWGELHKRIFKRFQDEKINIPFPNRTVHIVRETIAKNG